MSVEAWGMIGAGLAALLAGLFLVRARFVAASGASKVLVLAPIFEAEVKRYLPQIRSTGLILLHDASSHLKVVRNAAFSLEAEGLVSCIFLPTPRGLVLTQKREGRA